MTEKQFYDRQTFGSTDDVLRLDDKMRSVPIWSISQNGSDFVRKVAPTSVYLEAKIVGWNHTKRVQSNRLKNLADVAHLIESNPHLWQRLPETLRNKIDQP